MAKLRVLSKDDIASLLSFEKSIEVVGDAFTAYQEGKTLIPPVVHMEIGKWRGELDIKSSYVEPTELVGAKIAGGYLDNPKNFGLPTGMGVIILLDARNGMPLAIMEGWHITVIRTGASGALGIKYLARQNVRVGAVIGAGNIGRIQLRGLKHFRDVEEVRVFDIDKEAASKFVKEMSQALEVKIISVDGAQQAVEGADVVITCVPSREPVVMREWIAPGTHLNAIGADMKGKQELDEELFRNAKVVVDNIKQAPYWGECQIAVSKGILKIEDIYAEIGELTSGRKKGRMNPEEITIYDATGVSIQDIATAGLVYRVAEERNIGQVVEIGTT